MLWLPESPESLSPLLKIPLLFTGAYLAQRATTRPNPQGVPKEGEKRDVLSRLSTSWPFGGSINHMIWWTNAYLESAILLCSHYPAHVPTPVLSSLLREPQHDVSSIRLTPIWLAGWGLMVTGSLLRLSCHRALGRFFTWDLTIKPNQRIVDTGPYAVVRHPSYVGSVLLSVGSMMVHFGEGSWLAAYGGLDGWTGKIAAATWTAWSLGVSLMLMWRTGQEEEVLHNEFGAEWEAYARKTRYRFIPYIL